MDEKRKKIFFQDFCEFLTLKEMVAHSDINEFPTTSYDKFKSK